MFKSTLIAIFLSLLFYMPLVQAYSNPGNPSGFVNDFAGVLDADQKSQLEEKISAFEKETSNEIAVAIIKNLDGDYIENFAVKLFEDWKIGKEGKDNGVLILVAVEDREMRIEVGYGLEGALTDAQSYWIIKNVMTPDFRQGDFYKGIDGAIEKIMAATKGEYVPEEKDNGNPQGRYSLVDWFFLIFLPLTWLAGILARSKSWWLGGVIGAGIGAVVGLFFNFIYTGIVAIAVFVPLGLLFDFIASRAYQKGKLTGHYPWWIGGPGGFGRGGSGGGGFGGFGGGGSGGGGSSGRW